MEHLDPKLESFWRLLSASGRGVLFLDYDGTLAPFSVRRQHAFPYPGMRTALEALGSNERTRLVVVSGRAVSDLLPLLGLRHPPEVWGCHGWERCRNGQRIERFALPLAARQGLDRALRQAQMAGLGGCCEVKPVAVALHWRGCSGSILGRAQSLLRHFWEPLSVAAGLQLLPFDGGAELRCIGRNKGDVVRTVLDEEPAGVPAAYLGDDQTDEDAFAALKGRGLRVLVREEMRPSHADLRLEPPAELLDFLHHWYEIIAEERKCPSI